MQGCSPLVTAGVALPMMVNESVAAIFGRHWRDRGWPIAGGAVAAAGMILGRGRWVVFCPEPPALIDLANHFDGIGLGHGHLPG